MCVANVQWGGTRWVSKGLDLGQVIGIGGGREREVEEWAGEEGQDGVYTTQNSGREGGEGGGVTPAATESLVCVSVCVCVCVCVRVLAHERVRVYIINYIC